MFKSRSQWQKAPFPPTATGSSCLSRHSQAPKTRPQWLLLLLLLLLGSRVWPGSWVPSEQRHLMRFGTQEMLDVLEVKGDATDASSSDKEMPACALFSACQRIGGGGRERKAVRATSSDATRT